MPRNQAYAKIKTYEDMAEHPSKRPSYSAMHNVDGTLTLTGRKYMFQKLAEK